ncbi:MAG: GIY-YIG nuclease family protein, partial [Terracidiphilus sp.]
MPFTYVLQSSITGQYYTGATSDVQGRISQPNSTQSRSTKNRGPWVLAHFEEFATLGEALRRERYLKTGRGRDELNGILSQKSNISKPEYEPQELAHSKIR